MKRIMKFYVIEILMLSQQSGAINNKAISNFWSSISFPFSFDGLPVSAIVILDSKEWTSGRVHVSQTLLIFKVNVSKRRCEIYFRSDIFQKSCRNSPFLYWYYLHLAFKVVRLYIEIIVSNFSSGRELLVTFIDSDWIE